MYRDVSITCASKPPLTPPVLAHLSSLAQAHMRLNTSADMHPWSHAKTPTLSQANAHHVSHSPTPDTNVLHHGYVSPTLDTCPPVAAAFALFHSRHMSPTPDTCRQWQQLRHLPQRQHDGEPVHVAQQVGGRSRVCLNRHLLCMCSKRTSLVSLPQSSPNVHVQEDAKVGGHSRVCLNHHLLYMCKKKPRW